MKTARIYQREKSSTQSGRAKAGVWVLEYETHSPQRPDPLTGWAGGADTVQQVRLTFPTETAAVAYATEQGIAYEVRRGSERKLRIQSYADNFR